MSILKHHPGIGRLTPTHHRNHVGERSNMKRRTLFIGMTALFAIILVAGPVLAASPPAGASASPSASASASPSASASASPSGTPPPTDTLTGTPAAPSSDGWRLILLAMVGLLSAALTLRESAARKDRRR